MSNATIKGLWNKWKALRLPWRKQFLVGQDLAGNTFWEFRDTADPNRMRRIIKGHRRVQHSDVQITPQWHQWLRQTRADPPSLEEQQMDVTRQIQLKHNARLADERWAAKAKYIEKPKEKPRMTFGGNPEVQEGQATIYGGDAPKTEPASKEGVRQPIVSPAEQQSGKSMPDPWEEERQRQKQTAANPGSGWQPEAWTPGSARRK